MSVMDLVAVVVATTGVVTVFVAKTNGEKSKVRVRANRKTKK